MQTAHVYEGAKRKSDIERKKDRKEKGENIRVCKGQIRSWKRRGDVSRLAVFLEQLQTPRMTAKK